MPLYQVFPGEPSCYSILSLVDLRCHGVVQNICRSTTTRWLTMIGAWCRRKYIHQCSLRFCVLRYVIIIYAVKVRLPPDIDNGISLILHSHVYKTVTLPKIRFTNASDDL